MYSKVKHLALGRHSTGGAEYCIEDGVRVAVRVQMVGNEQQSVSDNPEIAVINAQTILINGDSFSNIARCRMQSAALTAGVKLKRASRWSVLINMLV